MSFFQLYKLLIEFDKGEIKNRQGIVMIHNELHDKWLDWLRNFKLTVAGDIQRTILKASVYSVN